MTTSGVRAFDNNDFGHSFDNDPLPAWNEDQDNMADERPTPSGVEEEGSASGVKTSARRAAAMNESVKSTLTALQDGTHVNRYVLSL
jgi:hypothetical protein